MGRARVGLQIHLDRAERHPAAVGRHLRLAHALQRHHVLKSERAPGLRQAKRTQQRNNDQYATPHDISSGKQPSVADWPGAVSVTSGTWQWAFCIWPATGRALSASTQHSAVSSLPPKLTLQTRFVLVLRLNSRTSQGCAHWTADC